MVNEMQKEKNISSIDILDVITLNRYLLDNTTLSHQSKLNADVDNSSPQEGAFSVPEISKVAKYCLLKYGIENKPNWSQMGETV